MKKSVLILSLIVIAQLKAMDPLSSDMKKWYEDLGIEIKDLLGKTKDERWEMVKKAYKISALQYHPDKNPGRPDIAEKWEKIQIAYPALENLLTEKKGPTLEQQMEEARVNADELIKKADGIDDPDEARKLYVEAIEPFIVGTLSIYGYNIPKGLTVYGLDTLGISSRNALAKYFKKSKYEDVVKYGVQYIPLIDIAIGNSEILILNIDKFNLTNQSYIARMSKPYIAKEAYNELLQNFADLKKTVELAFTEFKKTFAPLWVQAKKDFNSGNIAQIKNALEQMEDYFRNYEYKVDNIYKVLLEPDERNEYIKGYSKLADAYLNLDNIVGAIEALKKGLNVNNGFKAYKKISFDFTSEFERKLNSIKQNEFKKIHDEIDQGTTLTGLAAIASWKNILVKLYKLQPDADKLIFEVWNKIIERAENIGDIAEAQAFAQEAEKAIKANIKKNYVSELRALQVKIQTLNKEIQNIKEKKDEANIAMKTYTFTNEAHKFLVISDRFLAQLAKQDKKSRDWIIKTYNNLINSVDDPTKIKLARKMLEYENEWQGLDFVSNKENIEKILERLDPEFKKVPPTVSQSENLFEALKQLIRSFSILENGLLKDK